jgi:Icc-related predicted phosphoesterase
LADIHTLGSRGTDKSVTIFFATDIHGSDRCFRKFLNAGKFYGAQVLIMGGDLTGKMLVPITPDGSGWRAEYGGRKLEFASRSAVDQFIKAVRDDGAYVYECEEDELRHYTEQHVIEELIAKVALESVREWVSLADERLAGTGIQCLMAPGNDDIKGVEAAIEGSQSIVNPDGRKLELIGGHELIATGYSNITPWHTDRELDEDKLEELMEGLFAQLERPHTAVACLHVPPYSSGLDSAPRLDDRLTVQYRGGEPDMIPVGSTAVRNVLERHQPLIGLHGHIHESQGRVSIGRTVCVNPGSDYSDGVLKGALVRLTQDRVHSIQFVRG